MQLSAYCPACSGLQPVQSLGLHVSTLVASLTDRYADRDAQRRWASGIAAGGNILGMGSGIGGHLMGGLVRNSLGRILG
jgi:hypothetical protein